MNSASTSRPTWRTAPPPGPDYTGRPAIASYYTAS
ncbi:hypothetical protein QF030_003980 [Streptomyces rishiriensis]|uniref:Uncharacterized protein n=1 Tax=Streptomyces rishiriensis TaxID=68264 RepID=A0ABU0NTD8_STRRH|nr:hypothetical protein [Streptomyces rishiriensis]